jgi:chromosome segregation ATPase
LKDITQGSLTARASSSIEEAVSVMDSLNKIMSSFHDGLEAREKRRARAEESLVKLAALRRETVDALKNAVKNADRLKKELQQAKNSFSSLQRQETLARARYTEILSGRLPMANGEAGESGYDSLFHKESEELSVRKDQFMSRLSNVFSSLEGEIREIERRGKELREKMADSEGKLSALEHKRVILFQKLEIYKAESVEMERAVKSSEEEEERLLRDYTEFVRRLKPVLTIPPSTEKLLEKPLTHPARV